jgi:Zn-dependent M28 family amino/carboxypeptidase
MEKYLKEIVTKLSVPGLRNATGENWPQAMKIIYEEILKIGYEPIIQEWHDEKGTYRNFIVRIKGQKKEKFILGAHYDTHEDTPGADDNASAVAVMFGILKNIKRTPFFSWELVFYACEEPPFFGTNQMGSHVHASEIHKDSIKCMICLEMVGFYSNEQDSQNYPFKWMKWIYGNKGNFLLGVSKGGVEARRIMQKLKSKSPGFYKKLFIPFGLSGLDWSDHRNYWKYKIPAIMLTDTAMFRNDNYHKKTDLPDTLDYNKMNLLANNLTSLINGE